MSQAESSSFLVELGAVNKVHLQVGELFHVLPQPEKNMFPKAKGHQVAQDPCPLTCTANGNPQQMSGPAAKCLPENLGHLSSSMEVSGVMLLKLSFSMPACCKYLSHHSWQSIIIMIIQGAGGTTREGRR